MKTLGKSILRSAQRLVEGEQELRKTRDPIWFGFLKRESSILLRRSFSFWWRIRFRR